MPVGRAEGTLQNDKHWKLVDVRCSPRSWRRAQLILGTDHIRIRHRTSHDSGLSRVVSMACRFLLLLVESLPKGGAHQ